VRVRQLEASHPGADDDGLWFFQEPDSKLEVQIDRPTGMCPFLVEPNESETRLTVTTDSLVRKGYRFKGRGFVHRSDEIFQRMCQMYRDRGSTIEIRAVVLIRVDRALPVISPAYDQGATEEQVQDQWRRYCRKPGGGS
jgi:hypothetical protein